MQMEANAAPNPINESTVGSREGNVRGLMSYLDISRLNTTSSNLSLEGRQFVEDFKKYFEDRAKLTNSNQVPIEMQCHSIVARDQGEAMLAIDLKNKIVTPLLFQETCMLIDEQTNRQVPAPMILKAVIDEATLNIPSFKSLTVHPPLNITKRDYSRASNFAEYIVRNIVASHLDPKFEDMTLREIDVCTDLKRVQEFMNSLDPHAVPARADYGILLSYVNDSRDQNSSNYRKLIPFIGVTGYTKIIDIDNGTDDAPFLPVPIISNVLSTVPNFKIATVVLPIVGIHFAESVNNNPGLWVNPFKLPFKKDQIVPNLGMLVDVSQDGKGVWEPIPVDQTNRFVQKYCASPIIGIDLQDGRATIPNMALLVDGPATLHMLSTYLNGANALRFDQKIEEFSYTRYTGNVTIKGTDYDMRVVDYFHMLKEKVQMSRAATLTAIDPEDPYYDISCFEEFYAYEPAYITTTIMFSPDFLNALSNAVASGTHPLRITTRMPQNSHYNFAPLGRAARNYTANKLRYGGNGRGNFSNSNWGLYR